MSSSWWIFDKLMVCGRDSGMLVHSWSYEEHIVGCIHVFYQELVEILYLTKASLDSDLFSRPFFAFIKSLDFVLVCLICSIVSPKDKSILDGIMLTVDSLSTITQLMGSSQRFSRCRLADYGVQFKHIFLCPYRKWLASTLSLGGLISSRYS